MTKTTLFGMTRRANWILSGLLLASVPAWAGNSAPEKVQAAAQAIVVYHDLNAAKGYLLAAVASDAKYDPAKYDLGLVNEMQENWDAAARWYSTYLQSGTDPQCLADAKAGLKRVAAAKAADETPAGKAARKYEEAIARGRTLAQFGQLKTALGEAAAAAALDPKRPDAFVLSAAISARSGDYALAGQCLDRALAVAPDARHQEIVDLKTAIAADADIYARNKDSAAKLRANDYPGAVAVLQKLSADYPARQDVRLHLADAQILAGQVTDARATLGKIIDSGAADAPATKRAQELVARLAAVDAVTAAMNNPDLHDPSIETLEQRMTDLEHDLGITKEDAATDDTLAQSMKNITAQYQGVEGDGLAGLAAVIAGSEAKRKQERAQEQAGELELLIKKKNQILEEPRALVAAHALEKSGNLAAADVAYSVLLSQPGADRENRVDYARLLGRRGRAAQGADLLASENLSGADAALLVRLESQAGRYAQAAALYKKITPDLHDLRDTKDDAEKTDLTQTYLAATDSLACLGRLQAAEKAAHDGLSNAPAPCLHFALGWVLAREGRTSDAAQEEEKAVRDQEKTETNATVPGAWYAELASLYYKEGKRKEAQGAAQSARKAGVTDHPVLALL